MRKATRTLGARTGAVTLARVFFAFVVLSCCWRPARSGPPPTKLETPRDIQGVPCTGYVSFAPDGRLTGCILSREHAFGPIVLPAESAVQLRLDGSPESVLLRTSTPAILDGHRCRGGGGGYAASFHPNGRLRGCYLVADETVDGVPCRHGSFWGEVTGGVLTSFHDNGRLASCRLFADVTIGGKTYRKGDRMTLDSAGNVVPADASTR